MAVANKAVKVTVTLKLTGQEAAAVVQALDYYDGPKGPAIGPFDKTLRVKGALIAALANNTN